MSDDGGWTRSYRRKWKNPVFRNFRDAAIWSFLTDNAAWRDNTDVRFEGHRMTLQAGQIAISERFLAEGFCCDRQVIRRILTDLEIDRMVTRDKTQGVTILTICNYKEYQSCEEIENPAGKVERTQVEPRSNPNKKEDNNSKNQNLSEIDGDFRVWYAAYPLHVKPKAALVAYRAARRKASAQALLEGIERYRANKPEWQDWAHPSSWLNGERWLDEAPPTPPPKAITTEQALAATRAKMQAVDAAMFLQLETQDTEECLSQMEVRQVPRLVTN